VYGLQLLHNVLSKSRFKIHSARLSCLISAVDSLLSCKKLTLVNIGRQLSGSALVKNKIKKSDRLLGNMNLYHEQISIYQALCHLLINPHSQPIILVDWSGVTHCGTYHMIRASIPLDGRTLTIYEEVYPENKKDSPESNKTFLKNLEKVLPKNCHPIIVTDAGFRNPWFKQVLKMGWDFVGRVRNETQVRETTNNTWFPCKNLYKKASLKPKFIGEYFLAKSNPLKCKMFLMKGKIKNRKKKNLKGHAVRCSSSLKHAKRNKEPWLIATSLTTRSAKKIIGFYKLRMSIEQGFRDTKNIRHGFCLRETRSASVVRLSNLLLIGALATFIVCIYGQGCKLFRMQYQFQTNSVKSRKVLSWFFLGNLAIKENMFPRDNLYYVLENKIIFEVCYYA